MTQARSRTSSLGRQALLLLLGLLAPLVAILITVSWWQASEILQARINDALAYEADLAARHIEADLSGLVRETAAIARNPLVANAIADGTDNARVFLGPYLGGLHLSVPLADGLVVTGFDGTPIWPVARRADPAMRLLIAQAVEQGMPQARLHRDGLQLVHPVRYGPTGTFEGAIAVTITPGTLLENLPSSQDHGLRLRAESTTLAGQLPGGPVQQSVRSLRLPAPLDLLGLSVEASRTVATMTAPLERLFWLHVGLGILALAIAGVTAWFAVRHLTARLIRLSQVAVAVTTDLRSAPAVPDLGEDEVGRLATTLRTMLGELARGRAELEGHVALRTAQLTEAMALGRMGAWSLEVADGRFVFTDQFYQILKTTAGAQGGYLMTPQAYAERFVPAEHRELVAREVAAAVASADPEYLRILDHPVIFGDGSAGHLEVRIRTVRETDGRVIRLVGANQDITPRKRLEAELARSRDAAEAANRAKSAFLATMSHEIRTPLNGVLGMADLLQTMPLTPRQQEMVATIGISGRHLLTVINDILDFSKIEAGRFDLERIPFAPGQVLQEVAALFSPGAKSKGLSLTVDLPPEPARWVLGDPARVRQIVANLVGNAVKFTERGGVALHLTLAPAGAGQVQLGIAVRDTGIGIPPERLPDLFQPFVQADASITRRFGGSGLGLAISQRLAELMGGGITVTSAPGVGTEFLLRIPVATTETPRPAAPAPPERSGPGRAARILLAEDNPVNQRVATILLERLGHTVVLADHGQAALDILAREAIDLVLMDCQMPVMDGFTATRIWRARTPPGAGRHLPIIALTANAMPGDREACLAAGMDDYLTKPIQAALLEQALRRLLDGGTESPALPAAPAAPAANAAFDRRELERRLGDPALVEEVLHMARGLLVGQRAALTDALAGQDAVAIDRAAHALAGTLGNLAAEEAELAARRLMAAARAGTPWTHAARDLEAAVDRLARALG